jgi:hypothetical protein
MENSDVGYWDALSNIVSAAVVAEGSLAAVERAAGLKPRSLKYLLTRKRNDRPNGSKTTLSAPVEDKLRIYLQKNFSWPHPEKTLDELMELAARDAAPLLSKRERFARVLGNCGYFEEVSPDRISAYENPDLIRTYEPAGGLTPADCFAFGPKLYDEINRAELCEAVIANLIAMRGYEPCFADKAASSLHLYDCDDFVAGDDQLDFEALVTKAISNQTDKLSGACGQ